jgi:hypothetical protein
MRLRLFSWSLRWGGCNRHMTLNIFKAAVRTIFNRTDYQLLASGVRHMQKCGMSEREIFRSALSVEGGLDLGTWNDEVKTALESHPA